MRAARRSADSAAERVAEPSARLTAVTTTSSPRTRYADRILSWHRASSQTALPCRHLWLRRGPRRRLPQRRRLSRLIRLSRHLQRLRLLGRSPPPRRAPRLLRRRRCPGPVRAQQLRRGKPSRHRPLHLHQKRTRTPRRPKQKKKRAPTASQAFSTAWCAARFPVDSAGAPGATA